MDSLHPGNGTCFHDSIGHRDGVDSVHDTLEEGGEALKFQCAAYTYCATSLKKKDKYSGYMTGLSHR